jgi:SAM-dependent methyltransferase
VNCRHCACPLAHVFADLGTAPPSNAYLNHSDLSSPEIYIPLKVLVCDSCWLVQTEDYAAAETLFNSDYAYFSSTSSSWVAHAAAYATMISDRLGLDSASFVVEIASNDGYLLRNFIAVGIPCLGVEPTAGTADAARAVGVPVVDEFFGAALAMQLLADHGPADLIVGNNVYAHVPDINDFTRGLATLLRDNGTITLEFPHLLNLIDSCQFDTIYHEHYSYLSLIAVIGIFASCDLRICDVEEIPTHGGSLRIYGCHCADLRADSPAVAAMVAHETAFGIDRLDTYRGFQAKIDAIKDAFVTFLIEQRREGKSVAAYGAAAKGNTLINYAGVRADLLPYVVDRAKAKCGKYLPGSRIPIVDETRLVATRPEFIVLLPWNLRAELRAQLSYAGEWGARLVTAVPTFDIEAL